MSGNSVRRFASSRGARVSALVLAISLITVQVALADEVVNNLDSTVDATLEVMNLTVGGASGSVQYWLNPTGSGSTPDDGKSGCNLGGAGSQLVLTVSSGDGAIATVSGGPVVITACPSVSGPALSNVITINPVGAGSTIVTVSFSSVTTNAAGATTAASYSMATASFTVSVTNPAPPADTTPPVISYTVNGVYPAVPDGNNGWYVSDVTLDWTVTDPESAFTTVGCTDTTITVDQASTVYSCSASSAGGDSGPVTVSIKRDATAPTISVSLNKAAAGTGWFNENTGAPTAVYSCGDAMSGVFSCGPNHLFGEGADQSDTGWAVDNAGNSASATVEHVSVDLTDPTVTVTGPIEGAEYVLGSVPVAGCYAEDGLSGVASDGTATVTGGTPNGVGSFTVTCSGAEDNAGNVADDTSVGFTVVYGGVSGILQPINPDNSSVFKRGQTVPVKFRLGGDEFFGFNTSGWTIVRQQFNCAALETATSSTEAVTSTTPSSVFRYDPEADQYIYNASMKDLSGGSCWRFAVTLDSGQVLYSAFFKVANK